MSLHVTPTNPRLPKVARGRDFASGLSAGGFSLRSQVLSHAFSLRARYVEQ